MKNKKIWLGLIILTFVFVLSSCDLLKDEVITVPEWARGTWYINDNSSSVLQQIEVATITSKEFKPTQALTDLVSVVKKTEVTLASDNKVYFKAIQVTKGSNNNQILVGITLTDFSRTFYKQGAE